MATIANMSESSGVSIGGILGRAFGVMAANPIAIFGISLLLGVLPSQLYAYFLRSVSQMPGVSPVLIGVVTFGSVLLLLFGAMLAQAGIIRASVAYANGEQASFGECIAAGLPKILPLAGLTILFTLGIMFGFMLLFVPGVILAVMWSVATPALVAEPVGIFGALGRSRYLTKGARWKIFGMMLLLFVVLALVGMVLGFVLVATGGAVMAARMSSDGLPIWYMAVSIVVNTATTALSSTIITGLYISLRNWKDGPQADALADIFA